MRYTNNLYFDELMMYNAIKKELVEKGIYKGKEREYIEKDIVKNKKRYRKWLKEKCAPKYLYPDEDGKGYGEIVAGGGDWDSVWQKVFFKGEHWEEEDIEEFRKDNWKKVRYAAYDCTGDWFTVSIDVFNIPNGVVVYISEAKDV